MTTRRDAIVLLGGAAIMAWPRAAYAQATPVIGMLHATRVDSNPEIMAWFHRGLAEQGYAEGRNVNILYREAEGQYQKLVSFAAEFVGRNVDIIFATGGNASAVAAKASTATISIVFTMGSDPVREGIVASLNRPGANITGATFFARPLAGKRLALLREFVPKLQTIGVLVNPANPAGGDDVKEIVAAAQALGLQVDLYNARTLAEIESVFAALAQKRVPALFVNADAYLFSQRKRITEFAAKAAIPAIYPRREYVPEGGLISYAADVTDTYRIAGNYIGRILKGEKPANLPIQQPTRFEMAINVKAAKALGLAVPQVLLALADEVIE